MIAKTVLCKTILTKEEASAFILENSLAKFYASGIESVSGKVTDLDSSRVMMIKWRGRFGALSEKVIEFTPRQRIIYKIVEDSRGIFKAFQDFQWGFELHSAGIGLVSLVIISKYSQRKGLFATISEMILLRKLKHAAFKIEMLLGKNREKDLLSSTLPIIVLPKANDRHSTDGAESV